MNMHQRSGRPPERSPFFRCFASVLVGSMSALFPATSWGGLLANGSFEETASTAGGVPQVPGAWQGDYSSIVQAARGIQATDGLGMLRFLASRPLPPGRESTGCEVYQLIDLTPYRASIANGFMAARLSAQFNRVAGDEQTDERFGLGIYALDSMIGVPNPDLLPRSESTMLSDPDPATWQRHEMSWLLPNDTAAIYVLVEASENRFNDLAFPEFDGHYADDVRLELFTAIPGDTNGDGRVDLTDLSNVRNHFGEIGGPGLTGDAFPQDGQVNLADLNLVRAYFGETISTSVPEPSGSRLAWIIAAGGAGLIRLATRRSQEIYRNSHGIFGIIRAW